jgi:hypothetical protein
MGHALMENRNGLIVGAVTTRASSHAERLAALALIEPHADRPQPVALGADKGYDAKGGQEGPKCQTHLLAPVTPPSADFHVYWYFTE